jgi:hypothetical protein
VQPPLELHLILLLLLLPLQEHLLLFWLQAALVLSLLLWMLKLPLLLHRLLLLLHLWPPHLPPILPPLQRAQWIYLLLVLAHFLHVAGGLAWGLLQCWTAGGLQNED